MPLIGCYRCGAKIPAGPLDLERWAVLHAWEDGAGLLVCPQRPIGRKERFGETHATQLLSALASRLKIRQVGKVR